MAIIRRGNVADYTFRTNDYPEDELKVVRFEGEEAISELYRYVIEVRTDDPDLDLTTLAGRSGALLIRGEGDIRRVMGQVARAEHAGISRDDVMYVVELVPAVWYLTLRQRCRIFQEKNVPDIVKDVLDRANIPSDRYRFSLSGSHETREYCVQYRETDWDFIARLLEEEGIFFFFDHTEDGEILVMGDSDVVPVAIPEPANVEFHEASAGSPDEETIYSFRYMRSVRPGSARLMDFNFKKPKVNLQARADSGEDENLEIYDYPGEYVEAAVGDTLVNVRLEELRSDVLVARGEGRVRRLIPGFRVTLEGHQREELNQEYLVTRVSQQGLEPESLGRDAFEMKGDRFLGRFTAIPSSTTFRPPRLTPRPVVRGVQTAVVVGPSGEEIYTDEYGRVKVQFPWDLEGTYDDKSSCWIRVSHAWAGGQYGAIFTPRIGQEVIVDFIEGDPDRPIITGRVYNAEQMPPYSLPGEKTKSTVKSNSSTGGGGFNEIRFEDKAGDEQIWIHGQKDVDERIENDVREWVGNDKGVIVKGNQKTGIEREEERAVKSNRKTKVGGNDNLTVGGGHRTKITGDKDLTIGGMRIEKIGSDYSVDVTGSMGVTTSDDFWANASRHVALNASQKIQVNGTIKVILSCGASFIEISPSGIKIQGPAVQINCGGSVSPPSLPSAMTPAVPAGPGSIPEADEDEPGQDTTFSGGEEIEDPLEIEAQSAPHHQPDENWEQDPEKTWIDIELLDDEGNPVSGERYRVVLTDGSTLAEGRTDFEGKGRVEGIDPGQCRVIFPDLDKEATGRG